MSRYFFFLKNPWEKTKKQTNYPAIQWHRGDICVLFIILCAQDTMLWLQVNKLCTQDTMLWLQVNKLCAHDTMLWPLAGT
jgi:hypothetical protein